MAEFLSNLELEFLVKAVFEVIILTYIFYRVYRALAETKATQILYIVFFFTLVYFVSYFLGLDTFVILIKKLALPGALILAVIYHPELRRTCTVLFMGQESFFQRKKNHTSLENIDSILTACGTLVEKKRGALIVFPRHSDIKNICETGTLVDGNLTSSLILTIFDHDTPLHDGACIVQGDRISWAGCFLPLSAQRDIQASFGTRHRAALGMAENSDAVVLVVSEETGSISIAFNANIYYNLSQEKLKIVLDRLINRYEELDFTLEEENNG